MLTSKKIINIAQKHGLHYDDEQWNNSPADNRLKARLVNFVAEIILEYEKQKSSKSDLVTKE